MAHPMTQIERLIEQADEEVALHGENASDRAMFLTAIGYLLKRTNGNGNGRLNGKLGQAVRSSPWVVVAGMIIERVLA